MKAKIRLILASAVVGVVGCAAAPRKAAAPTTGVAPAYADQVTTEKLGPKASLPLDEIEPRVNLTPGTGSSAGQAPLEAVHFYAQAQAAIKDHDRASAIELMEKAVALDPISYMLRVELARLYLARTVEFDDRSIEQLEKAAELEPDHLDMQTDLGRQLLAKGNAEGAFTHLRLALKTRQYPTDVVSSTVAEFFLATMLRNQGYDTAALDVYQRLTAHLKSPGPRARFSPELMPLLEHADAIDFEIADLLVHMGRTNEAMRSYADQVKRNPGNFELRKRQVRLLIASHHRPDAFDAAQDAVIHFRANSASISLLEEAVRALNPRDTVSSALRKIHDSRPKDRTILYALVDALRSESNPAEARRLLADAADVTPGDFEILRRRVALATSAGDTIEAARVLIHTSAAAPDVTLQSSTIWSALNRPSSKTRLRWDVVKSLDVPASDECAKWFWVWRLASAAHRTDVAEAALRRAVVSDGATRPFFPAFRDRIEQIWDREDLDDKSKKEQCDEIAKRASEAGSPSSAEELRAVSLMRQNNPKDAIGHFQIAMADPQRRRSPDFMLELADALRKIGDDTSADSLLWKLISDQPTLREAYLDLFLSSLRRKMENQAERVVTTALESDPGGITPRRIQSIQYQRAGRPDAAEGILVSIFNDHSDDPEAIGALSGFYLRRHQTDKFIKLLQDRHAKEPANYAISVTLAETLALDHHGDEAVKIIDSARAAAVNDADLLYSIAGVYARLDRKQTSEEVLQDVLRLDPRHAAAANDLGYTWTEEGRNLAEAETLIRKAVEAEPHNLSFLDSMGWLYYKRGKFKEARAALDRALGKTESTRHTRSDPVMLDHRGDALYRLGEKDAAASDWQRAADRITALADDADEEMKGLQTRVLEKARKLKAGEEVSVAPVNEGPAAGPARAPVEK